MADTTYSVKLPEEVQERIKQLVETSGMSNKEFISSIISNYELEQTKQQTPILAADIDELRQLTQRMNSIFVGVGERVGTMQDTCRNEMAASKATNEKTIQLLQQRIEMLESDHAHDEERVELFKTQKEITEKEMESLKKEVQQLNELNTKNDTIIDGLKQKVDDLTADVVEYKQAAQQSNELAEQVAELERNVKDKTEQVGKMEAEILKVQQEKTEALKTQQQELNLEREKAVLELKQEHQEKVQTIYEKHREQIVEYEMRAKGLLSQLEPYKSSVEPKVAKKPTTTKKAIEPLVGDHSKETKE